MGEARIVEGQAACGVLVAGIKAEALNRIPIGQALETLQDHDHRHDQRRHAPTANLCEQIAE